MSLPYPIPPAGGMDLNSAPKASQACLTCRRQKRKCDKALPGCSLCVRMSRNCDYSTPTSIPTSEDFNALRQRLHELEGRVGGGGPNGTMNDSNPYTPATTLSGHSGEALGQSVAPVYIQQDPAYLNVQNRFPSIVFLDTEIAKNERIVIPKPVVDIPGEVYELLGDTSAIQAIITDYFETVHTWWPILSKKRLMRNMHNPLWDCGHDVALLYLCMKLHVTRPQEGSEPAQNPIYMVCKRFLALMEATGAISLSVLQSYVLISVYEYSQSVYPAAWMSPGASIRYGYCLGVHEHKEAPKLLGHPATWNEREERLRTWWGALIMDRCVSLGGQGRSYASEDPGPALELPVDTVAWDEGEIGAPAPDRSAPISEPRTPFARLCQGALVLGKVIRHHYSPKEEEAIQFEKASELYFEASELARQVTKESQQYPQSVLLYAAPTAVCFSALANLCEPYACKPVTMEDRSNTADEHVMIAKAIEGLEHVAFAIKEFSRQIIDHTPHSLDIDRVSPLIMDTLYSAAADYAWRMAETSNEMQSRQEGLDVIRHCLQRLGSRFRNGAEFLRILEAQEFNLATKALNQSGNIVADVTNKPMEGADLYGFTWLQG